MFRRPSHARSHFLWVLPDPETAPCVLQGHSFFFCPRCVPTTNKYIPSLAKHCSFSVDFFFLARSDGIADRVAIDFPTRKVTQASLRRIPRSRNAKGADNTRVHEVCNRFHSSFLWLMDSPIDHNLSGFSSIVFSSPKRLCFMCNFPVD